MKELFKALQRNKHTMNDIELKRCLIDELIFFQAQYESTEDLGEAFIHELIEIVKEY